MFLHVRPERRGEALASRTFEHSIDHAAAAAAAEDESVRALENLDAFEIVEIAEILDVVAHAVEKEVGCRVIATQGDLVAVPLALSDQHAGRITHGIGD